MQTWKPSRLRSLLFRGSDWYFSWDGKEFTLSMRGLPPIRGPLLLIQSFTFQSRAISSTVDCRFQIFGMKLDRALKGLKQSAAAEIKAFIDQQVIERLSECAGRSQASLDQWQAAVEWRVRALGMISPETREDLKGSIPLPLIAGLEKWEALFEHPALTQARRQYPNVFPALSTAPASCVDALVETHNRKEFERALASWVATLQERLAQSGWLGHRAQVRMFRDASPPQWPGKAWNDIVPDELKPGPDAWWTRQWQAHNVSFEQQQMVAKRVFFDRVESNPLTEEQARAVVCMDDELLVVAAAGSGKSSTIVAKAGYALEEGLCAPEDILLLAFNTDAAEELRTRIAKRLGHIPGSDRITAKTFHAFGLEVVGAATGRMPATAPWLQHGEDVAFVASLAAELSAEDGEFATDWNMFRLIFLKDLGRWDEFEPPEDYDQASRKRGFRTLQGEVVKSKSERVIADWLFLHGVNYTYETPYPFDTRTPTKRQYCPDFFYPDINVFHEHFALDVDGRAPPTFIGYEDGVAWKRTTHRDHGTILFETTSHELRTGSALRALKRMLEERGVTLVFDPNREAPGRQAESPLAIAKLIRVFQQHMKGSRRSMQDAYERISEIEGAFASRMRLFLAIYARVAERWEERLSAGGLVDFDDMLNHAADLIEARRYPCALSMVLADEFQDTSRARMRLIQAIVDASGAQLTAVGDDWQGIYRFAGADIATMTGFSTRFPRSAVRHLSLTFRCPQDLCDLSSAFISKNPRQIPKEVRSTSARLGPSVRVMSLPDMESIPRYVEGQLQNLHGRLPSGHRLKILMLGRYRSDCPTALAAWRNRFADRLDLHFLTIHRAKGLEADVVLLLNVIQGTRGFPSQIEDDPILQLAMPTNEDMSLGEERRLLYVALTRAKQTVMVYTTQQQPSEFVVELLRDHAVPVCYVDGEQQGICPACGLGLVVQRQNRETLALFNSCSRFPQCDGRHPAQPWFQP
jgi:DNA helicase IV